MSTSITLFVYGPLGFGITVEAISSAIRFSYLVNILRLIFFTTSLDRFSHKLRQLSLCDKTRHTQIFVDPTIRRKKDNRPSNIEVMTRSEHSREHGGKLRGKEAKIVALYQGGKSQREIGTIYGVSHHTIGRVLRLYSKRKRK